LGELPVASAESGAGEAEPELNGEGGAHEAGGRRRKISSRSMVGGREERAGLAKAIPPTGVCGVGEAETSTKAYWGGGARGR
jgi:hypothetical protein